MTTPRYYLKFLNKNKKAPIGTGYWPRIGTWTRKRPIVFCQSGWHLATPNRYAIAQYMYQQDYEIYVAEGRGEADISRSLKHVYESARLVARLPNIKPAPHSYYDRPSYPQCFTILKNFHAKCRELEARRKHKKCQSTKSSTRSRSASQ